jgi:hypothetical protein
MVGVWTTQPPPHPFSRHHPPAAPQNLIAARASRIHPARALPAAGSLAFCLFVFWSIFALPQLLLPPSLARFHSGADATPREPRMAAAHSLAFFVQGLRPKRAAEAAKAMTNKTDKNRGTTRTGAQFQTDERTSNNTNPKRASVYEQSRSGLLPCSMREQSPGTSRGKSRRAYPATYFQEGLPWHQCLFTSRRQIFQLSK